MRRVGVIGALLAVVMLTCVFFPAPPAQAEDGVRCAFGLCEARASGGGSDPGEQGKSPPPPKEGRSSPRRSDGGDNGLSATEKGLQIARQNQQIVRRNAESVRRFDQATRSYESCLSNAASECGAPPSLVLAEQVGGRGGVLVADGALPPQGPAGPPVPTISPEQAAYLAVARLRFPTTTPGIGPPPSINKWKMAAVGYPLWLWSEGPSSLGPVSDSVADVSVSLRARIGKTVFRMGDGKSVSCSGVGRRWTRAIRPGQESTGCGYAYEEPSLPRGKYTVTAIAFWTVDWTVNGTTGQITVPRASTTQLPVGELQSLVR